MSRIVIIGNAGGGKSTLARKLAVARGLQHVEIDRLLWQEGWKLAPTDIYMRKHDDIIATDDWVIDGLGQQTSIPSRIARATEVILIDMPLWMHFWLEAENGGRSPGLRASLSTPQATLSRCPQPKLSFDRFGTLSKTGCQACAGCVTRRRQRQRARRLLVCPMWTTSTRSRG
jgi:hypothetical protein